MFFWQCGPIWRLDLAGRLARSPTDGGKTALPGLMYFPLKIHSLQNLKPSMTGGPSASRAFGHVLCVDVTTSTPVIKRHFFQLLSLPSCNPSVLSPRGASNSREAENDRTFLTLTHSRNRAKNIKDCATVPQIGLYRSN